MSTTDNIKQGIYLALLAMLCFALMNVAFKWYSALGYSAIEIIFFRCLFSFIPIGFALYKTGGMRTLRTQRPMFHFIRSLVAFIAILFFVLSVKYMPLVDALALAFMAPVIVATLSVPLLKEHVGLHRWIAIIVGFVGGLIVIQPGFGAFQWTSLFGIFCAFSLAFSVMLTRKLSKTESTPSMTFWGAVFALLASGILLPLGWKAPEWIDLIGMVVMGLLGGIGQLCLSQALKIAPPTAIAPYEYSALIWGALFGYLIWSEVPNHFVMIGTSIIISSGLYIFYRESLISKKKS